MRSGERVAPALDIAKMNLGLSMEEGLPPRVVKILQGADQKRRVLIVERDDGTYTLISQRHHQNVYEGQLIADRWASMPAKASIYQTVEIAEREATEQFRWLTS